MIHHALCVVILAYFAFLCLQVFKQVAEITDSIVNVRVSYVDIYNEHMRDLLTDDTDVQAVSASI